MSLPGQLVDVDGVRIFVHRSGKGGGGRPPVVFLHGYTLSMYSWRDVLPRFVDAGHAVIAVDLPGHGESDRPRPDAYGYDAPAMAATIKGLLDRLDVGVATLVGHSMGGAVTLATAARHPDRFARLVVVDPCAMPFELPRETRMLLTPVVGELLYKTMLTRTLLERFFRLHVFGRPEHFRADLVDYWWERINRPGGRAAMYALMRFLVRREGVPECAARVRTPTLILWGERDRLFPVEDAPRLGALVPGSTVEIVPGVGHTPMEEQPATIADRILAWLGRAA